MPDYPGAVAAIKQRVADNWSTTAVAWAGDPKPVTTDGSGNPKAWVLGEVINTGAPLVGAGLPGSQIFEYFGLIHLHVFVPTEATGTFNTATTHATALGEVFRNKLFYNATPGYGVRTWFPRVDGGGRGDDDGLWFRVTATIPFTYRHIG